MYSFIVNSQPKSYNSQKTQKYKDLILAAFRNRFPDHVPIETKLYGLIYHFFRRDIGIDADNLSKPIWDCLRDVLYKDDKQIKMRTAGSFDVTANGLITLDFSGLPETIIDELFGAMETEEHVLYIECGDFSMDMIRLNLERYGN